MKIKYSLMSSLVIGIIVLLIALSFKVQGKYYCSMFSYLDGGEYYVMVGNGEIWLCGENSLGKINNHIGRYEKNDDGSYKFIFNREKLEIIVYTSILGLKIRESDVLKMGIKSPKIGVEFIRIL